MAKRTGVKVLNAPVHPSMKTIGSPSQNVKGLRRGWIIQAPNDYDGTSIGTRFRINFLYNPSQIVVSHTVASELSNSPELWADEQLKNVDNVGSTLGQGSITLPLLFDRTYELWDRSWANKGPGQYGVYWDVVAFYHFTNLTNVSNRYGSTALADLLLEPMGLGQEIWANMYPVNPMFPQLAYVYIGAFGAGTRLKYFGQITNLEINYTHWNYRMIPMRCTVSVTMELLADPNARKQRAKIASSGGHGHAQAPEPSSGNPFEDFYTLGAP